MLRPEHVEQLKQPIYRTWNLLHADAGHCTNGEAMELCLDAGRLVDLGKSRDAETLLRTLLDMHGYKKVHKYLTARIQLV